MLSRHRGIPLLRLRGELSDSGRSSSPAATSASSAAPSRLHPKPFGTSVPQGTYLVPPLLPTVGSRRPAAGLGVRLRTAARRARQLGHLKHTYFRRTRKRSSGQLLPDAADFTSGMFFLIAFPGCPAGTVWCRAKEAKKKGCCFRSSCESTHGPVHPAGGFPQVNSRGEVPQSARRLAICPLCCVWASCRAGNRGCEGGARGISLAMVRVGTSAARICSTRVFGTGVPRACRTARPVATVRREEAASVHVRLILRPSRRPACRNASVRARCGRGRGTCWRPPLRRRNELWHSLHSDSDC